MFTTIGNFILSEWIWSVTRGIYHIPWNIIIMIILLKFFLRINMVSTVFLSIGAQLFSTIALTIITLGTMLLLGKGSGPESYTHIPTPIHAFIYLGIIYAALQTIFFTIFAQKHAVRLSWMIVIAMISNNLTVLLNYLFTSLD